MGQLDVGLRRSLHEEEMVHLAHFSVIVLKDGARTGRIKEELLSASGLLHTLAANGKRTHMPFSHSHSQPPFNVLCLRLNCGRKLEKLETLCMHQNPFCCRKKVLQLIEGHQLMESQKFRFKILYVYKGEPLDWEYRGMQSWKTLLRAGAKLTRTFKEENFLLSRSPSSPSCHGDLTGRRATVRIESFKLSLHISSRTL